MASSSCSSRLSCLFCLRARPVLRILGGAAATILLAACGNDGGPKKAGTPAIDSLESDGAFIRDSEGRAVLFRGVNARVAGVFDVTFDDGRAPLETIPKLEVQDCQRMYELGFEFLRLPINWSGVEPSKGQYDESYLDRVAASAKCAGDAGVHVLVDMHQDAYSKEIGEDGAPLWAIQPPPTTLLGGPLNDLSARRLSSQVLAASATFFDPADPAGVRAAFLDAFAHVADRFADDPAVVGFEVFNEPLAPDDAVNALSLAAAQRARQVAPKKLVFFEPNSTRNLTDKGPLATSPFGESGGVYAPHIYTGVFSSTVALASVTKDALRPSMANAQNEARAWGTPLFIGEFGIGPTDTNSTEWVGFELDLMDEYFVGSSFWVWKEQSQGSWGLFDHDDATDTWTERTTFIASLSRPHASRVAGTPTATAWDPAAKSLTIQYQSPVGAENRAWIGSRKIASATCDGSLTPTTVSSGFASASCGTKGDAAAHTLVLTLE